MLNNDIRIDNETLFRNESIKTVDKILLIKFYLVNFMSTLNRIEGIFVEFI